jgi:hypothetical protein
MGFGLTLDHVSYILYINSRSLFVRPSETTVPRFNSLAEPSVSAVRRFRVLIHRQNRPVRPMTFRDRIDLSVRRSTTEPALEFEVQSVEFQDLDRQRDMVFFCFFLFFLFFFFFALNYRRCCSENFRIWFSRHGFPDLGSQLWGLQKRPVRPTFRGRTGFGIRGLVCRVSGPQPTEGHGFFFFSSSSP